MKNVLAAGLGLITPFVFILGAAPFEVRGRTSLAEVAAGCVAVILYLAFCQYRVALKAGQGPAVHWNTVIASGGIGCLDRIGGEMEDGPHPGVAHVVGRHDRCHGRGTAGGASQAAALNAAVLALIRLRGH
jgi:hypothetical protein